MSPHSSILVCISLSFTASNENSTLFMAFLDTHIQLQYLCCVWPILSWWPEIQQYFVHKAGSLEWKYLWLFMGRCSLQRRNCYWSKPDLTKESINDGLDHSSSHLEHLCLQNLSLAYNKFSSPRFNMLRNLSSFDSSNSGFAGQIPIEISCLTRLVTLNLSTDSFLRITLLKIEYPNLAMLVQNVSEFKELYLDGVRVSPQRNEWSRALPSSQSNIRVLSILLYHPSGHLDSSLILSFNMFKNLTQINLTRNNLTSQITSTHWEKLLNLVRLHDLRYNSLEGSTLVSLFSIPSLQKPQLSNDPFFCQVESESTLCLLSTTKLAGPIFFTRSELEETHSTSGTVIDWNYIIAELGFIFGLGIIYWPLIFSNRWRIWYFKHIDGLLFWMFPQLYLGKQYHKRWAHRNKGQRHH